MAHFAQLDENNKVINVIVVKNELLLDENENEIEQKGIDHLKNLYGLNTNWKQTSINDNFRKQYAALNGLYNEENDLFIMPKPFESWSLNENFDWVAPVDYPNDGEKYIWDENNNTWVLL